LQFFLGNLGDRLGVIQILDSRQLLGVLHLTVFGRVGHAFQRRLAGADSGLVAQDIVDRGADVFRASV
jgi:hypothetical protein